MMGHTHLLIGGATWLGYQAMATGTGQPAVSAGIAFGGWVAASYAALLPDLDSKKSLASQMFGWPTEGLSYLIRTVGGGHRKITHSLVGLGLVTLLTFGAVNTWHLGHWVAVSVLLGWISHVVADMLTKEGCPLLWPISSHNFGIHLITTGMGKKHGHHTMEWWLITPLSTIVTFVSMAALLVGR
jgi:membrane-bound metal-dependent hydrolase YbcI (DUF457 family)